MKDFDFKVKQGLESLKNPSGLGYQDPVVQELFQFCFNADSQTKAVTGWVAMKVALIDACITAYERGEISFASTGQNDDPRQGCIRRVNKIIQHQSNLPPSTLNNENIYQLANRINIIQMWNIYFRFLMSSTSPKRNQPLFTGHIYPDGHPQSGIQHCIGYHYLVRGSELLQVLDHNQHGYHASDVPIPENRLGLFGDFSGDSVNSTSIGYCALEPISQSLPSQELVHTTAASIVSVCSKYNFAPDFKNIMGHDEAGQYLGVSTINKGCPGKLWKDADGVVGWKRSLVMESQNLWHKFNDS